MSATAPTTASHVKVAVIGAGFAGVAAGVALREEGIEDYVVIERADTVGGVWRDNTYPGAACDIPSHLYSYSFAPKADWARTFSRGGQIKDYIAQVAEDRGVMANMRFGEELLDASWDETARRWSIRTTNLELTADVVVDACGPLTEPRLPDVPGLEDFPGTIFHSARWNHDHDLAGERVAVIGTGASSIQLVPEIQPRVGALTVFQRTPGYVIPRFDRDTTALERRLLTLVPGLPRLRRAIQFAVRDGVHYRMIRRNRIFRVLATAASRRMLRKQVADPELRAKLTPDYEIGCKRVLISNDWYRALAQPNVDVVASGVKEIRGNTIVASDGSEHEVDTIILSTGFEVLPPPITERIHGRDDRSLADAWRQSLNHYRAVEVVGFPNYFRLAGVGCGLGHGSLVFQIESQTAYLKDALRTMKTRGVATVEVSEQAQAEYMRFLSADLGRTVWSLGGCSSWYQDASGEATGMWPRSMYSYRRLMRSFDPAHHDLQAA